ncbi:MAG: hypothetical protein K2G49_00655 [Muribaculum sp.]|nr:hypothetical protein [Muribaculum sp.]
MLRATFQSPLQLRGGAFGRFATHHHGLSMQLHHGIGFIFNTLSIIVHVAASRYWFYFQCIINNYPYRQCRGEWKLARVAPGGASIWVASPPGIDRVSAVHVLRATFQSPLQLRGGALR